MESPRLVRVELLVGGMTCAACAAKVENKLNALENVSATVNYAKEKATVAALPGLGARGVVDGHAVIVGREKLFRDRGLDIPAELALPADKVAVIAGLQAQGRSVARHPERRTAAPVGDNPPEDGSQPEEQAASCLE